MDADPVNRIKALKYHERSVRGYLEENRSSIKKTWVGIQNSKDYHRGVIFDAGHK
jgi:hypothetical protein